MIVSCVNCAIFVAVWGDFSMIRHFDIVPCNVTVVIMTLCPYLCIILAAESCDIYMISLLK